MNLKKLLVVVGFLSTPVLAQGSFFVVALGDSVSTAFNAERLGDNEDLSWSTGADPRVESHGLRFARALMVDIKATNVAKAGAKARDLAQQWDKIKNKPVDYASILIGANDVCAWNEDDIEGKLQRLKGKVENIVQDMTARNPFVRINILPLPNLYNVERLNHGRAKCEAMWAAFSICDPLLLPWRSDAQRREFQTLIERVNDGYQELSEAYENVSFNRELAETEFSRDDLSEIDCFHPSLKGQQRIAQQTWDAMFPNGDEDVRQISRVVRK